MNFIRDDGIKLQAFFTIYESDIGYTLPNLICVLRQNSCIIQMELDAWSSEHLD